MKSRPVFCLIACLVCAAAARGARAQSAAEPSDFESLLARALARDSVYAQRLAQLKAAKASLAGSSASSLARVSLSTGQSTLSLPRSGYPLLSLAPALDLSLSAPANTSLSLGMTASVDFENPDNTSFKPSLRLTQPLEDFIWGRADSALIAVQKKNLADAREALEKRASEFRLALCSAIRDSLDASYKAAQARYEFDSSRAELERALAAGSYTASAAALAKLRLGALEAQTKLKTALGLDANNKNLLDKLAGENVPERLLPPEPERIEAPGKHSAAHSYAVVAALRSYELVLIQFTASYGPPAKRLGLSLSGSSAFGLDGAVDWDAAAALYFERGAFGASLGAGAAAKKNSQEPVPYVSFKIDWKPDNAKKKSYDKEAAAASLEVQALAVKAALAQSENTLADYARQAANLIEAAKLLELQNDYARAYYDETAKALAAGLSTESERIAARWALDKIDFEHALARCDRAILALKIRSMFPVELKS